MTFLPRAAGPGPGARRRQARRLGGGAFATAYGVAPDARAAHAFPRRDFVRAAPLYGRVGGFAHLATLVARLKASRPGALLLDGGDTWQGSATSLWTRGQDMIDAQKQLGVDVMTGHWEFAYGQARVKEVVDRDFKGSIEFVAQNIAAVSERRACGHSAAPPPFSS